MEIVSTQFLRFYLALTSQAKFVLIRKEGAVITVAEARTLLTAYGSVIAAHSATPEELAQANTHDDGVFVTFEKFGQGQAALAVSFLCFVSHSR